MEINKNIKELLTQQVEVKVKQLRRIGWSNDGIGVYLQHLNKLFEFSPSYLEAKELLKRQNLELSKLGSDLYLAMLKADSNKAIGKIKIIEKAVGLQYNLNEDLTEDSEFFNLVDKIVAEAVEDGDLYRDLEALPTRTDYFVLTTLNQVFNNFMIGKYKNYGRVALQMMFENAWELCDKSSQNALLNGSRYHTIGFPIPIDEHTVYDPASNIKILSRNKRFEQIYNMGLEMFLNEIHEKYPEVKTKSGYSTNLATYNYGYISGKVGHGKIDVAPFNVWGNDYLYRSIGFEDYDVELARDHESGYAKNADTYVENWEKFHPKECGHITAEKMKEKIKEKFGLEKEKEEADEL